MPSRILTNDIIRQSPTWERMTVKLPFLPEEGRRRLLHALQNARAAVRMANPDDTLILTDTHNLSGSLLGLFLNGKNQRPTLIRTDPLFNLPGDGPFHNMKVDYFRRAVNAVDRLIVWAPAVIDRYERYFGIPREKMIAQKFHHTLTGYELQDLTTGNYIFSGGDSMRDYETLIQAVSGLDVPLVIATRTKLPEYLKVPANVRVSPVSHEEFRRLMAEAFCVVFPLRMDRVRTSGQQSYLNAMALGKTVIVTDTEDAPFYIEHGKTGLLTPSGDPEQLRGALETLLQNTDRAREIGAAAKEAALPLDQEFTWTRILATARETHDTRHRAARGKD